MRAQLENNDRVEVKAVRDTTEVSGEVTVLNKTPEMSTILEPPSFVGEKKSFGEYKKDLLR